MGQKLKGGMGSAEEEKAAQLGEEEDIEEEEEEGEKKKKKKGMCAKLLKFFASLGGQYQRVRFYNLHFMLVWEVNTTVRMRTIFNSYY